MKVTLKDYVATLKPYRNIGWNDLSKDDQEYYKMVCDQLIADYPEYKAKKGQFKYELVNQLIDSKAKKKFKLGRKPEVLKKSA